MPTERLLMRRIRELLRLRFEVGLSTRLIATSLGISKGAVGDYLQRVQVAGLGWPLPEDLDDTALERRLFPGPPPSKAPRAEPDWAAVDRELRRKGVTRSLLWQSTRSGCTSRITREMSRRSASVASTRPSGWPRNRTSVTPTCAAAVRCSASRRALSSARSRWSGPPASPEVARQ